MAPTCFGLRPSSGSLQLIVAKVRLMLKHSARLHRNLLRGVVAACLSMACVLCSAQKRAHNTHGILGDAATPQHNTLRCNLTECFNINISLARHNCKLPMMVVDRNMQESSNSNVNCNQILIIVNLLVNELCADCSSYGRVITFISFEILIYLYQT